MIPEERRWLRHVEVGGRGHHRLELREMQTADRALGEMRCRRLGPRPLREVDEFVGPQVHQRTSPPSIFFKLLSAWKKFAFTAPTELPSTSAISWCDISWYIRRTSVARCFRGNWAIAARTRAPRSSLSSRSGADSAVSSTNCLSAIDSLSGFFAPRRLRQTLTPIRYSHVASDDFPRKLSRPRYARKNTSCQR